MDHPITFDRSAGIIEDKAQLHKHVLADYYRCLTDQVPFLPAVKSTMQEGYFRFGADTICYGQLSYKDAARSPLMQLADALEEVAVEAEAEGIKLPFNPSEVVENLRRERYAAHFRKEGQVFNEILRKAYYFLRPCLGVSVRRHLQKMRLRGWSEISFPAWPVDTTVERIHQKLLALSLEAQGVQRLPFIWFWPEGFMSCAIITHDVESSLGWGFCRRLMDLNESFEFRSSFQVVPENRYSISKSFLQDIEDRGFEVNIHDLNHDGRLYAERAEFLRRAKRINSYAREYDAAGFRSGVLYRNADWYDALEFSYDMSFPNVAHLDPQRGGCCTVMPYFIGKIVELPVTCTQDYTLFHILGNYSIDLWKKQIALIMKNHGLISLIVHPDYIQEQRAQATYKNLLSYLSDLRVKGSIWAPLPKDVAAWWRERSKMELVYEGGKWRIEGAGKERACIAYAARVGNTVTYSLER